MSHDRLRAQLIRDEGRRLKPYTDTVGKLTIGCGRNLTDKGISLDESNILLDHDIEDAERDLRARFPWVDALDPVRLGVLINMSFNLGIARLAQFTQTLDAIRRGEYDSASVLMLQSKWAKQVKDRAARLAEQMRTGEWT